MYSRSRSGRLPLMLDWCSTSTTNRLSSTKERRFWVCETGRPWWSQCRWQYFRHNQCQKWRYTARWASLFRERRWRKRYPCSFVPVLFFLAVESLILLFLIFSLCFRLLLLTRRWHGFCRFPFATRVFTYWWFMSLISLCGWIRLGGFAAKYRAVIPACEVVSM